MFGSSGGGRRGKLRIVLHMLSVQTQLPSLFSLFSDRMSELPHKHTVLLNALLVRSPCRICTALSICPAYKLALANPASPGACAPSLALDTCHDQQQTLLKPFVAPRARQTSLPFWGLRVSSDPFPF